jgi:hypothetical protein
LPSKFAHSFSKETHQSISHIVEEYLIELKKNKEQSFEEQKLQKRIEKLYCWALLLSLLIKSINNIILLIEKIPA